MKVYILQLISGYQIGPEVLNVFDDLTKVFDSIHLMCSPENFVPTYFDYKITQKSKTTFLVQVIGHNNIYLITQAEVK